MHVQEYIAVSQHQSTYFVCKSAVFKLACVNSFNKNTAEYQ